MVSIVLFACNPIKLSPLPNREATVYGNGGSAVVKDNYIYFANSYVDFSTIGINDNRYDAKSPQVIYGIYRAPLNKFGRVNVTDGRPEKVELVSYNIGGYAYSGLYICGDYLYYSTPYSTVDESGTVTSGRVRFERVRLDGTERTIVYSCANYSSDCAYDIVYVGDTTYICIKNGDGSLVVVKCRGNNIYRYTISDSITSFAVFEQRDIKYGETLSDFYTYVYYSTKDSNDKYNLYRKKLDNSGDEELILGLQSSEISVVSVKNEKVYYTLDSRLYGAYAYGNFISKRYSSVPAKNGGSDASSITSYLVLDDNNVEVGILGVYYDGSSYSMKVFSNAVSDLDISSSSAITLLGTLDGEVYYQVSGDQNLYVINLTYRIQGSNVSVTASSPRSIISSFQTSGDHAKSKFDFDKDRVFTYAQVDDVSTGKYLTMYMINNPYRDEEDNIKGQYVGVLSSADDALVYPDEE